MAATSTYDSKGIIRKKKTKRNAQPNRHWFKKKHFYSLPFRLQSFSSSRLVSCLHSKARLAFKGQAGANLVAGLVELGSVEGEADTERGSGVEPGVVGKCRDTTVVDLGLWKKR